MKKKLAFLALGGALLGPGFSCVGWPGIFPFSLLNLQPDTPLQYLLSPANFALDLLS